mmetsp:Transcript_26249/g.42512  ORF Transcript_26249/g.42512 Transcript_26249/m.42512 type:complete len:103 (+) Transcript_26249:83-391(+)
MLGRVLVGRGVVHGGSLTALQPYLRAGSAFGVRSFAGNTVNQPAKQESGSFFNRIKETFLPKDRDEKEKENAENQFREQVNLLATEPVWNLGKMKEMLEVGS